MRSLHGRVYCQRCRAVNSVADETCARCGTRLMLVVEPTNLRFEEPAQAGGSFDEHLLERVSLLENNLSRVIDKLERTLDLMLKQAQSSHTSHALLDALISALAETGALDRQLLREKWLAREGRPEEEGRSPQGGGAGVFARVVGRYAGDDPETFRRALAESLELLAEGKLASGAKSLAHAALLDPGNAPLRELLAGSLIAAGRPARAVECLLGASGREPATPEDGALLGLALAETGDAERARALLRASVGRGVSTFAVHFALGRLSAAGGRWREALAEFKLALARRERPESYYHVGLAHARLGHLRAAEKNLVRAAALDEDYAEAWEELGRVLAGLGDVSEAKAAYAAARRAADSRGAPAGRPRGRARRVPKLKEAARREALFRRRLVTGGDPRLTKALWADLLGELLPR